MSKQHKRPGGSRPTHTLRPAQVWLPILAIALVAAAALWWTSLPPRAPKEATGNQPTNSVAALAPTPTAPPIATNDTNVATMNVASSVMVTQPLDFGARVPTPAEALQQVERVWKPDDGVGRTFSILEAFGFTNETGKLQLSMRVSTEKPGMAALIFKPTGKVLWQARIVTRPGAPPEEKQLTVMVEEDGSPQILVDGSKNPASILDASIHQSPLKIRDQWPDGAERTVTFIYSTCGCPVKARVQRVGDQTRRTSDWPVLFPDDADAMRVINSLMGWPADGVVR